MTGAAEHPPDPGAIQCRPLDVAAPLPRAAVRLSLPDWVQHLVVAAGQAHRGLYRGFELRLSRLSGWLIGWAGVRGGLFGTGLFQTMYRRPASLIIRIWFL